MNKMKAYFLLKGYTTNDDHEEDEYKEKEKTYEYERNCRRMDKRNEK